MRAGLLVLLCGCRQLLGFEQAVSPTSDSVVLPDVEPLPDAAACTELTSSCVAATVLRSCTAIGELPVDTVCSWGCIADDHCGVLQPTGGAAAAVDLMVDPTLVDITLSTGVINTDTGAITGVRSAGSGVRDGIGFEVRNGVGVFHFKRLSITGPISALGVRAVVLVANEDIVVSSTLVATGCAAGQRSPGGSLGGAAEAPGTGPGAGGSGIDGGLDGGGGGAGHGVLGGSGGNGGTAPGGTGGAVYGAPEIPLISAAGGSGGGGGADLNTGGAGGAGGGAIQLISNTTISISVSGGINAGGCGGKLGADGDAGGGGGSGGTIVLEAPIVEIAGGVAVNGGGGGGGDAGTDGTAGELSLTEAAGGDAGAVGGTGGAGAALGASGVGQNADRGGGGGGGVGRIRITTRDGSALIPGFTSPALGSATATSAAAIVQ